MPDVFFFFSINYFDSFNSIISFIYLFRKRCATRKLNRAFTAVRSFILFYAIPEIIFIARRLFEHIWNSRHLVVTFFGSAPAQEILWSWLWQMNKIIDVVNSVLPLSLNGKCNFRDLVCNKFQKLQFGWHEKLQLRTIWFRKYFLHFSI